MTGPWEKFQSAEVEDGPWARFTQQPKAAPLSRTDKLMRGVRDPIDAGAQMLENMLPDSVVSAVNKGNNWLADKTGLVARLPGGGVDQMVREDQAKYQQQRQASGESGFDGWRTLGNVISPVNAALAARIPLAATLPGRAAIGVGAGGASGALTPVGEGDFVSEKLKQVGMGAAVGGALPFATGALSRLIQPKAATNQNLAMLRQEGVRPTIGQTLGGRWNAVEEKLQSLPIMGDSIALARGRALFDFNKAAINRATGKVGAKVDSAGQQGIREAGDAVSGAYNDALGKISGVRFDSQFNQDLSQLHGMAQNLVPSMRDKFNKTYADIVAGRMSRNGSMLPESYKQVDSELGNLAARYGKSQVASEQELGDALAQLQNLLKQQMHRSNPGVAGKLREADEAYANLVRVEGAGKAAKNADGLFTPAQLNAAIQAADGSVRKRAVSRGEALMQDLGNAGQSVLGNKVPNSFTADRMLLATGGLGSAVVNPAIPVGLLGGAAAYSPLVQKLLSGAATQRPASAKKIAELLKKTSPYLLPASGQVGAGFVNN